MSMRVFLAAALMLLTTLAFAEHAISLDAVPAADPKPTETETTAPTEAAAPTPAEPTPAPTQVAAAGAPASANAKVIYPSEIDVYLVKAGTREVCDTFDFGGGDVRTDCRTEQFPLQAKNPALRGICMTRYGNRTCY